ncbi:heterokaryon incompatibility protein-domain-containing protein [Suillus paluster]|uniref:heterokaryon incompatibility protein-domain-containing protein n=1 Tax=Suillus paluster TaxID=48578 RepID=UPI001B86FB62|nr:heterokaryon incompatibility protein-domain-containing protein [Suillus paluster]KAG1728855.1 heterokaryon incompatibility protein-domain-containing protein [Suillus paluster]
MSASASPIDKELKEVFYEYIDNEIPIHLLHISKDDQKIKVQLVNRNFIKERFFDPVLKKISAEFPKTTPMDEDREDRIKARLKEELKYAMFSHRWLSDEEEPLHCDVSKGLIELSDRPGKGWQKLENFCRAAIDDHDCEFAWSDTCCIDKTSSSELDESIRSMFRWYRNSHVCIALLSGTAHIAALQKQEKGERGEEANIDAWFTRGWTLQELLAPLRIKFYGNDWKPLIKDPTNDRDNEVIMSKISDLTNIDVTDLRSFTPGIDRVPEKMLWASRRRTTRIEDVAYSLIGILDISFMIAYGEGNKAFFRLMEEILKRYDKWDVFLWSGRCSRYNAALPNAPHCYVGGCTETSHSAVDEGAPYENGDRRFALTNHGLEVRVLLLEVEADISQYSHNSCITFRHDHFKVDVTYLGPKHKLHDANWAIGVLDYCVVSDEEGFIDRSSPFTGFLLSSNANASPHLAATAKWKKEMTKEVIIFRSPDHVEGRPTLLYL